MQRIRNGWISAALVLVAASADAQVTRVEVRSRADVLGGRSLGLAGPYEALEAKLHFAIDPRDPHNRAIADIDRAPTNAQGRVEFSADLFVVKPKDPSRGNGAIVLEVPNRGRRGGPEDWDHLIGRGFTIVSVGWQYDVVPTPGLVRLYAPVATEGGAPITGLVRYWFRPDAPSRDYSLEEPARGTVPYPVVDPASANHTLTVRLKELDEPRPIPREKWRFAKVVDGKAIADATSVYLESGFEAGLLYEVVYRAQNPGVAGLGFAAVRDAVSHLRNNTTEAGAFRHAYAWGVSQSGRFLRGLLYEGFNTDLGNRPVFDGIFDLVAGGVRSGFTTRFAQPSLVEPARFPFSDADQRNPHTGWTDGLLKRAAQSGAVPKVIHLNTSNEYWTEWKAAAMVHTSVDGTRDLVPPDNVRIYTVVGSQHGPRAALPPRPTAEPAQHLANPNSYHWVLRGLVVALDRWVRDGVPPPANSFPRLSDGSLVPLDKLAFPKLPAAPPPSDITGTFEVNGGARVGEGIIDILPPRRGQAYPVFVPQVDGDGNEPCCLRLPEVAVPLATYTGWNLRHPSIGGASELSRLEGAYIPFPRTKADRARTGDPRASIEERYTSREQYLGLVTQATLKLLKDGYLLSEDVPAIIERAQAHWDWAAGAGGVGSGK
jgi:hypothetical protein